MQIGDKLYYVNFRNSRFNCAVTVATVGRKWFTLVNRKGRFSIDEMYEDGGDYMPPGRCYQSEEVYQNQIRLDHVWANFRKLVSHTHKPPCEYDGIKSALKSLNLNAE